MLKLVSGCTACSKWRGKQTLPLFLVLLGCFCGSLTAGDHSRVRTEVEINGKIRLKSADKRIESRSLTARGEIAYDEKREKLGKAVRYYLRAEGHATVGNSTTKHNLRPSHRPIAVEQKGSGLTYRSAAGPLTQDELDILEVQFDPLLLGDLLPTKLRRGATSEPNKALVASLFVVDVIHQSDIVCEVTENDDVSATIHVKGKASGAIDGVSTSIEVSGQIRLNLATKAIERLAIAIKESRSIGHASPGFDVTATVKSVILPLETSRFLTSEVLDAFVAADSEQRLVAYSSKHAGIQLSHDQGWKVMVDRPEALILRMVDQGDLIGQCNISRLAKLPADQLPTLEQFKSNVREALADNFGQFVDASRSTTAGEAIVLRVAAAGTASGLAVHWVYYHVSDATGRRVSAVFTSEAELASRFSDADVALIGTLRFEQLGDSRSSDQLEQARTPSNTPARR